MVLVRPAAYLSGPDGRPDDDLAVVRDGREIGEIEEVLANDRNEIVAVVVELDDILDVDDDEMAVPIDRLEFGGDGGRATISMSDDELRALPVWDDRAPRASDAAA